MAYMMVLGHCFGCKRLFTFNADKVPSIRVNAEGKWGDPNGKREPICKTCVDIANPERIKRGLPPILVLEGAYEAEEVM